MLKKNNNKNKIHSWGRLYVRPSAFSGVSLKKCFGKKFILKDNLAVFTVFHVFLKNVYFDEILRTVNLKTVNIIRDLCLLCG